VRARSVLLSDRWWESPASPLLAYLGKEKRPVALLPSGARKFKIVDPGAATTGILTPEIAADIAPSATMFYMPLPEREVTLRDIFAREPSGTLATQAPVLLVPGIFDTAEAASLIAYWDASAKEIVNSVANAAGGDLIFTGIEDDPSTLETLRRLGFTEPSVLR
jgi:hypothetical protein